MKKADVIFALYIILIVASAVFGIWLLKCLWQSDFPLWMKFVLIG